MRVQYKILNLQLENNMQHYTNLSVILFIQHIYYFQLILQKQKYDDIIQLFFQNQIQVVLVGDTSVGKTHLLKRYSKNELPKNSAPTIGVEFGTKEVTLKDGTKVKAQIWDTAGQERYRGILSLHFRRAVGALLVYDVTKEKTYNSIMKWMEDLKYLADPDIVIMLVGNKIDLVNNNPENRKVTIQEAQAFAFENKLIFKETSAVLGTNIKEVFEHLLQEIYNQKQKNPQPAITNPPINLDQQKPRDNSDCSC